MDRFPKMVFRPGSELRWNGCDLDIRVVADEDELAEARREGWSMADDLGKPKRDPLDHDNDGVKGGSLPGEQSTRSQGRRKKLSLNAE